MDDVAKMPGLYLRGNVWAYRRRVPDDLRGVFGKLEIKFSLRTQDYKTARFLASQRAAETERLFESLRRRTVDDPCDNPREAEARILIHFQKELRRQRELLSSPDATFTYQRRGERLEDAGAFLQDFADPTSEAANQALSSAETQIFGAAGIPTAASSAENLDLADLILAGLTETQRQAIDLLLYRSPKLYNQAFADATSLQKAIADYLSDYKKTTRASTKRVRKIEVTLEVISEFFGNVLLKHVSRLNCREFRDFLNELPSNLRKSVPDRSIALREAARIGRGRGLPPMAGRTQAGYLGVLQMFMSWAVSEHLITKNPAEGLDAVGKVDSLRDARHPFLPEHLQAIFKSPTYERGRANWDLDEYRVPQIDATRFWVPLIGLFSGMRLNEICQLELTDIVCEQDIWFFNCTLASLDRSKSLKNGFSQRRVPVHSTLVDLGLLDYLKCQQKSGVPRLFPNLELSRDGHRSERFSRWFNESLLPKLGFKTRKLTFHSFRHTWRDALRNALVPDEIAEPLGGWNTRKGTSQIYGGRIDLAVLSEHLNRITYRGLDLSHLA